INFSTVLITKMICLLVIWLHNRAGVSRSITNKILQGFQLIISVTLSIVGVALSSSGLNSQKSSGQHAAPSAFPSFLILFLGNVSGRHPQDHNPVTQTSGQLRILQMVLNGSHFLLSSKVIEDSLHETFNHHRSHPPAAFHANMNDIQDSPAWDDLQGFLQSPYHLLFGIYIDWFNPYTNKISGKKVSCGAILLYCLNLPFHLRYQFENTFIAGLTPPHHVDPTTISHLLERLLPSMVLPIPLPFLVCQLGTRS
ncbi:hypothetical protein L208DRAFT_1259835, partial [Tricholoma matsutake]